MQSDDDIAYNGIHLGTPNVFINGYKKEQVVGSEFFSVDVTTSCGISADIHDEAEQLYELLVSKKDIIDHILESQPVYAIGPNIDENCHFPCITCWATSCLESSILEQLEKIFNYEFRAVCQVVEPMDGNDLSSGSSTTRGSKKDNDGDGDGYSGNDRSGGDDSGSNDGCNDRKGGGDDDDDNNSSSSNNNKFILVHSLASVGTEDQKNIQVLNIHTRFHAKIDEINKKFFINVDVACEVSEMLSEEWKQLANEGHGYFLEALKIEIAPISSDNVLDMLIWREQLFPEEKNVTIEHLANLEKQASLEIGMVPKAGVQVKQVNSTKTISDEWKLRIAGTGFTGYSWSYQKKSEDPKLVFRPGSHICGGKIESEKLCGFHVTVTETLCFKFTSMFPKPTKFRVMRCPKIAHILKMTFNDIEDFNKKFAKLGCYKENVEGIFPVNNTSNNKTTTTNSGERSVINQN